MRSKLKIYGFAVGIFALLSCTSAYYKNANVNNHSQNDTKIETHAEVNGIYVATEWQKPIPDNVLKNPNVDGVFLRLYWAPFEPDENKFDWSFLDEECRKIALAGKKISIGIMAGNHCPDWIYTKGGVEGVEFTEIPLNGKSDRVLNMKIPVPWNSKFLQIWTGFVQALAEHLKSDFKIYNAITIIKITGINEDTIEARLPAQNGIVNRSAQSSDAPTKWKTIGYKPKLVMDAWKQIIDCFANNFNDKAISLGIISGTRGFPAIDESGSIVQPERARNLTLDLIDDGLNRYKGRFIVQFNALGEKRWGGANKWVQEAGNKGAIEGFQLNQTDLAHPACLENDTPCDEEMFKRVLDNGIDLGASFIEIFQRNVEAYPKAIAYGHKKLVK